MKSSILGLRGPDPKDKRDLLFCKSELPTDEMKLPSVVFNPVKIVEQWLGSCTGASGASLASGLKIIENKTSPLLSSRWVYAWNKIYDGNPQVEGSFSRFSVKTLQKNGVPPENLCPIENVDHARFIDISKYLPTASGPALDNAVFSYLRVNITPQLPELKQAIARNKFAILSIEWYSGATTPIKNIIRQAGQYWGGHSICCCGYITALNEDAAITTFKKLIDDNKSVEIGPNPNSTLTMFILANSFGTDWGYKGYCLMPANYPVWDGWTVTDDYPDDWRMPPAAKRYGCPFIHGIPLKDYLYACYRLKKYPLSDTEHNALAYGRWHIEALTGQDKFANIYYPYMTKDDFNRLRSRLTGSISDVIKLRNESFLKRLPLA